MPVDVAVPLAATETEDIEPLDRENSVQRGTDPVEHALELEVLVRGEVGDDVLAMVARRHERVPQERGEAVQERERPLVLVHDVVWSLAGHELADEARTLPRPPVVGRRVDRAPAWF